MRFSPVLGAFPLPLICRQPVSHWVSLLTAHQEYSPELLVRGEEVIL